MYVCTYVCMYFLACVLKLISMDRVTINIFCIICLIFQNARVLKMLLLKSKFSYTVINSLQRYSCLLLLYIICIIFFNITGYNEYLRC